MSCPTGPPGEPSSPLLPPLHLQQPRTSSVWSVLDVTRAPHGTQQGGGFLLQIWELPQRFPLPSQLTEFPAGFKTTTTKSEAQTYSRTVCPGGSWRRPRLSEDRGWLQQHPGAYGSPHPHFVTPLCPGHTEQCQTVSPPCPHRLVHTAAPKFCGKQPPDLPTPSSQPHLLPRLGSDSPVLKQHTSMGPDPHSKSSSAFVRLC